MIGPNHQADPTEVEEVMEEVVEDIVEAETETATLRPVRGTLTALNVVAKESDEEEIRNRNTSTGTTPDSTDNPTEEVKTASITPVRQMVPKKQRGPPPSSKKGEKPSSDES